MDILADNTDYIITREDDTVEVTIKHGFFSADFYDVVGTITGRDILKVDGRGTRNETYTLGESGDHSAITNRIRGPRWGVKEKI